MPCPLRGSGDTEQAGEHPSRWSPVRTRQAGVSRGKQGGLLEEEGGQEQAGRRGPGGASSEPRLGFPGRTRTLVIVAEAHTGPQSAQHGAHTHTCLRDPTITCGHTRHGLRLSGKAKSHSWAGSQDRRGSGGSEPRWVRAAQAFPRLPGRAAVPREGAEQGGAAGPLRPPQLLDPTYPCQPEPPTRPALCSACCGSAFTQGHTAPQGSEPDPAGFLGAAEPGWPPPASVSSPVRRECPQTKNGVHSVCL